MNIPWPRAAKAVAGGLLLLLLFITVNRWWGDYRVSANNAKIAAIASSTASSTAGDKKSVKGDSKKAESKGKDGKSNEDKYVIVVRDGLNFRYEPNSLSRTHGGLRKGQKLVLIKKENGWYQVEDDKGTRGWVSASPDYTKLQ